MFGLGVFKEEGGVGEGGYVYMEVVLGGGEEGLVYGWDERMGYGVWVKVGFVWEEGGWFVLGYLIRI